jgi:murein DD-endopeptidase MepM/ murein hydrolase activator NlpD
MKFRLLLGLVVAVIAVASLHNRGLWHHLGKPFRIVRMLAAPPDLHLRMPVEGAAPGRIANTWHAPRGAGRRHEGQDIFAPRGTPVVSATGGIIVRVGENRLGGQTVSILGSGGRTYYYAHLDRYADTARIGCEVAPGDIIGYVGNTGNARTTPPHLHFGVYTPSGAVDPLSLLLGAGFSRALARAGL